MHTLYGKGPLSPHPNPHTLPGALQLLLLRQGGVRRELLVGVGVCVCVCVCVCVYISHLLYLLIDTYIVPMS